MAKEGSGAIPKLQELLRRPETAVRVEAVKAIVEIASAATVDLLLEATRDNDPEVQMRAIDGLVNFYLPGYVRTGPAASIRRAGNTVKSKFTGPNDQVIESYVTVRPDVIQALGKLIRGGASMEVRANAARATGMLRGNAALPDLLDGLRSKHSGVLYEILTALQKLGDESAAPKIAYLLHDLDGRVQIAAIETSGILRNRAAVPELKDILKRSRENKVRRAALTALAMLSDPGSRELYAVYLQDRDEHLRAAAAEGFARLRDTADVPMLEKAYEEEGKNTARISLAFALVMCGQTAAGPSSPLTYLINNLNSVSYRGEAYPFLLEAARLPAVRDELYAPLENGTRDEKIQLAKILAANGDRKTMPYLEKVSRDSDGQVAEEGLRALRNLKARLEKSTSS